MRRGSGRGLAEARCGRGSVCARPEAAETWIMDGGLMLDAAALPTIRHAIQRRLGEELGVAICEIRMQPCATHITVGVLAQVDGVVIVKSVFDLPIPFELGHLHD